MVRSEESSTFCGRMTLRDESGQRVNNKKMVFGPNFGPKGRVEPNFGPNFGLKVCRGEPWEALSFLLNRFVPWNQIFYSTLSSGVSGACSTALEKPKDRLIHPWSYHPHPLKNGIGGGG